MTEQELKAAIQKFYSDQSRSREQTKEGLEDALDEIEMLIETLEDD